MTVDSTAGLSRAEAEVAARSARRPPRRRPGIRGREAAAGWLFTAPVIVLIVLFLV
ncbi:MAG: hypothetical protein QOD87_2049, partial [Pseudonocardiales bacterium]|nr:hypothetical protein [Pseudonocardiales bacterium]